MPFLHRSMIAALASLPLVAAAQAAKPAPDPAESNAAAPPAAYVSSFDTYRGAAEEQASPDKAWRAANDTMGRLKGHAGHHGGEAAAPALPARPGSADQGGSHKEEGNQQ